MSRPRTYQTEAIIIKKTRLGEADRILALYTPRLGKIHVVAKGVRRPRSKMAGHLELLTHSQISLARGRNLDTVTGCQTIDSFLPLKSDLWLTSCALYVTELVEQFTADHVESLSLFRLLLETMRRLCQGAWEPALRYFEVHLLDVVGYRPQLQQCVSCQKPLEPVTNSFCPAAGGMLCSDCSYTQPVTYPLSVIALKVLRFFQGSDYDNASRVKTSPELSHELDRIMRRYIEFLLEREVKSAVWLDSLKRQFRPAPTVQTALLQGWESI
jgi:DNA repair protein RecO (recombination protein O)